MVRITKFSFLLLASLLTVSSAEAQVVGSSAACGCQSQACDSGCSPLSNCGRRGGFFNQSKSCDCGVGECAVGSKKLNLGSRLGQTDCGGCQSGCNSCGAGSGIASRLKGMFPTLGGSDGCGCKYLSVFGGWSDLSDYSGVIAANPTSGTFNDGFVVGIARGRYLNANTRFEIENSWRNNSGENWNNFLGTSQFDGHFNAYSTMLNTVREFGNGRIRPYAGAGVGLTVQDGDFDVNGNHFRFDDWRLAYQGILGINVAQTGNADVYCEYRYLGNTDSGIEDTLGNRVDEFSYLSESVVFGIRIKR